MNDKTVIFSMKCNSQISFNQRFIFKIIVWSIAFLLITSCAGIKQKRLHKSFSSELGHSSSGPYFSGLFVLNPQNGDTLFSQSSDHYFIPASNVKIFTLYSGLKLLPKRIPALKYQFDNDTLLIEGTGDPSFLNPNLADSTAYNFLRKFNSIALNFSNYGGTAFMPGWAWEDYPYYFSPEIGPLPLFGNVVTFRPENPTKPTPVYFRENVNLDTTVNTRSLRANQFFISPKLKDTLQIPFIISDSIALNMLRKELGLNLHLSDKRPTKAEVLLGMPTDSLLKQMMWESDNFIAEQLMLVASSTLSDTLHFDKAKNQVLKNNLTDLAQEPKWVDGSGLSRYNLFTPESMVSVLLRIKDEISEERLYTLFPAWTFDGTVTDPKKEEPYFIYAKSGSMGGVYNLSGYLKTEKGKTLVFSLMNNNFRAPSREIRLKIYKTLKSIHEAY